jgi:putative membrane protein
MVEPGLEDATRRTRLANERTYLAWLRTGFTAIAVAVGTGKLVPSVAHLTRLPFELAGAAFALLGVAGIAYGAKRYLAVERALDSGGFAPLDRRAAVGFAAVSAALGLLTLALVFVH